MNAIIAISESTRTEIEITLILLKSMKYMCWIDILGYRSGKLKLNNWFYRQHVAKRLNVF